MNLSIIPFRRGGSTSEWGWRVCHIHGHDTILISNRYSSLASVLIEIEVVRALLGSAEVRW